MATYFTSLVSSVYGESRGGKGGLGNIGVRRRQGCIRVRRRQGGF